MHLTTTTSTVPIEWPLLVLLVLVASSAPAVTGHRPCPFNASEPAPDGARLVNDTLWAGHPERPYPPSAYRPVPGGGYDLCTCTDTAKPCLRKCCKSNTAYNETKSCSEFNKPHINFTVPIFVNATGTIGAYDANKFKFIYGKPICVKSSSRYRMEPFNRNTDSFRISESGRLLMESGNTIAEPDQFCLEQFGEFNYTILPVVCSQPENNPHNINTDINIMHTIGMILSLPFLFSTFLVYALIGDLQNLHGKSLMCHVATLLMAYTSLIAVQLITDKIDTDFCIILAFIIQFSFLASFFWLNVMCFDLWWTFSGFRPIRGNLKEHEAKKFIIYSIYAWGCTSSISLVTMCMQQVPSNMSFKVRPEFGEKSCWFGSKPATLLYFYAPIGILLFSNLLMFIYTAVMIVKHMRDANVFKGSESNRNVDHEKQRFMLYLKLFIVMGVNWLAEIISWATDPDGSNYNIWYLTDIGNSLQGVLIFLIFVCKKRVLRLLNKKLCPRFELFKTSTISTRTTNSFTSRSSTKNKDVEMTPKNVQNSTINQLHDFKV